jgi:hypothetical protein
MELYFSKIFATEPRLGDLNRPLYWLNSTAQTFIPTPINKIYKVDFLWASEGQGMASRYGHAMIRLVVCSITENDLQRIEHLLNHRPRKVLGFKTPHEVLNQINCAV